MAARAKRRDVEQEVTDKIIDALENGNVPWEKGWSSIAGKGHCNAVTGHVYRGMNVILTAMSAGAQGFGSHQWVTFKQAKDNGGNIKKGEKGTLIIFNKPVIVKDKDDPTNEDKERTIWVVKGYTIFNLDQTEGLDRFRQEAPAPRETTPDEFDRWVERTGIMVKHGGDRACYMPALDFIRMPTRGQFVNDSEYASTMCHELGHATGAPKRLARFKINDPEDDFGSEKYAKEELVAELAAAFTMAHLGLEHSIKLDEKIESHAAYIKSWLRPLKKDKKFIFRAAGQASKASDWLLEAADAEAHEQDAA